MGVAPVPASITIIVPSALRLSGAWPSYLSSNAQAFGHHVCPIHAVALRPFRPWSGLHSHALVLTYTGRCQKPVNSRVSLTYGQRRVVNGVLQVESMVDVVIAQGCATHAVAATDACAAQVNRFINWPSAWSLRANFRAMLAQRVSIRSSFAHRSVDA